jgi:hypothetical protein
MKFKKIIPSFLILVMVLQLLPVRQAVRYFLIDNQTVEEIAGVDKSATKNFRFLDEDHCLQDIDLMSHHLSIIKNIHPFYIALNIPPFHTAEVLTPPPNTA